MTDAPPPWRFATSVKIGTVAGIVFSVWNLVFAALAPLAEDTLGALAMFYGPMFAVWGVSGFMTARRSGRLVDGVMAGTAVAFITFAIFHVAAFVRINLFLEAFSQRSDWQNMMARYRASGFESLRAFVNHDYLVGAPFKIFVATAIGTVFGAIGGLAGSLSRETPAARPLPHR